MATGYYYYGARYYDPKRSFWLSADPLAEITLSPYAYVWNDPVNFADPTGLMGERVGGKSPKDWYRDRFGNVSWHDSQEDQITGQNGETLTRLGKSGSYVNSKGTTTHLNRDRSVTEGGNNSITLKPTPMSGAAMSGSDVPQISSPGKMTAIFSEFDTSKYYPVEFDRFTASGFHPALMDPSASMFRMYVEAQAGSYLFRAFRGVLLYEATATPFAVKNTTTALSSYYPVNGGAMGSWSEITLETGTKIDRFGSGFGKYFSPKGTPMEMRALPPGNSGVYNMYEVVKPFKVQSSTIAPAFGKIGTGKQYYSPFLNASELEGAGFIKKIP